MWISGWSRQGLGKEAAEWKWVNKWGYFQSPERLKWLTWNLLKVNSHIIYMRNYPHNPKVGDYWATNCCETENCIIILLVGNDPHALCSYLPRIPAGMTPLGGESLQTFTDRQMWPISPSAECYQYHCPSDEPLIICPGEWNRSPPALSAYTISPESAENLVCQKHSLHRSSADELVVSGGLAGASLSIPMRRTFVEQTGNYLWGETELVV